MDPQMQTVVEQYFVSLKDSRNRHLIRQKYTDLSGAKGSDIEQDIGCWYAGFTAGIKLLDSKTTLQLDSVLSTITKRFSDEGIAA